MVDYNIEFSHIYLDQFPSSEQYDSIPIVKNLIKSLKKDKKTYSLGVMIDDFSPIKGVIDFEAFINLIKEQIELDYYAFESQVSMLTYKFISEIDQKYISKKIINNAEVITFHKGDLNIGLISKDNKPTCALLVCIWYLSRLGIYGIPSKTTFLSNKEFFSKNIITVLPKKYKNTEDKVYEILNHSKYKDLVKNMENIYY